MKSWGNGREASSGKAAPYRDMQALKALAGKLRCRPRPSPLMPCLESAKAAGPKEGMRRAKRKGTAASLPIRQPLGMEDRPLRLLGRGEGKGPARPLRGGFGKGLSLARRDYSNTLALVMSTAETGTSEWMPRVVVFSFSILSTVSMPSMTLPNTQ